MQTNARKRRTWHDRGLCTGKEKAWPWRRTWHDREQLAMKENMAQQKTLHCQEQLAMKENMAQQNYALARRTIGHEGEQGRTENDALARRTNDHEGVQAKIEHDALARRTTGHDGEQGRIENDALARRTMTMKENMTWQRTVHWQGEQLAMKEKAGAWKESQEAQWGHHLPAAHLHHPHLSADGCLEHCRSCPLHPETQCLKPGGAIKITSCTEKQCMCQKSCFTKIQHSNLFKKSVYFVKKNLKRKYSKNSKQMCISYFTSNQHAERNTPIKWNQYK